MTWREVRSGSIPLRKRRVRFGLHVTLVCAGVTKVTQHRPRMFIGVHGSQKNIPLVEIVV